jgi:hypothetical protein
VALVLDLSDEVVLFLPKDINHLLEDSHRIELCGAPAVLVNQDQALRLTLSEDRLDSLHLAVEEAPLQSEQVILISDGMSQDLIEQWKDTKLGWDEAAQLSQVDYGSKSLEVDALPLAIIACHNGESIGFISYVVMLNERLP